MSARQALIHATRKLLAQRDVTDVSVKEIATAASVNHGLVHHYFGSKEGLLCEVVVQLGSELRNTPISDGAGVSTLTRTQLLENADDARVLVALTAFAHGMPELRRQLAAHIDARSAAVASGLGIAILQAHALVSASLGAAALSRVHEDIDPTRVARTMLGVGGPRAR